MPGLASLLQSDFSAGAFIGASSPERIPRNGLLTAQNGLVDDSGSLRKRGGSTFFPGNTWPAGPILWVWQGTLTAGVQTLLATATGLYRVTGAGTAAPVGYTGMATGPNRPAVINGVMYLPGSVTYDGTTIGTDASGTWKYYAATSGRLLFSGGNGDVGFSPINTPGTFTATDFWRLPGGTDVIGLSAIRDSGVVFSDQGTWVISNMALNLTDADGNVQQRLDLYAPDLILWGQGAAGVVGYGGGLIVPGRDGVWLMSLGVTSESATPLQLLSGPIVDSYKLFVLTGWTPGLAAVYRGHYFLPLVLAGFPTSTVLLVCRLDRSARPWTELDGFLSTALTVAADGRSLIGGMEPSGGVSKVATLNYVDAASGTDADGTTPQFVMVLRDQGLGGSRRHSFVKMRAGYRSQGASLSASFLSDGQSPLANLTGTAPTTGTGWGSFTWPIGKRAALGQAGLVSSDNHAVTVSSVELLVRQSGRQ